MKTLTLALCELLYLKKPSRIPSRSLTSQDNSRKRSHFSKPRVSRQWPGCNLDGKSLRNFLQPPQQNSNDADFGMGGETTLKSMENNSLIEGAHEEIDVTEDKHEPDSFKLNRVLLSGLKFAVLFGLLSIQGSQQAAATEFTTGIQPLSYIGDLGDISTGFVSAFLLIFFSELGDKTFFIAALLAARNSGAIVFTGTFGALATMTVVSVILGRTFHYIDGILPFRFGETDLPIDDIAAVCLLVYFGVSTLLEAASGDDTKAKEEQKEAELAISELSGHGAGIMTAANTVISTFLLVFVAEWGDKSFFSTIALAAASSPLGVIGGALAGHAVATLLAVLGGSLLGTFLSDKVIAYTGGVLFLVFALATLVEIVS